MFTKRKIKKTKEHISQYVKEWFNYLFFFIDKDWNSQYQIKARKKWEEIKFHELGIFNDNFKRIKVLEQEIESGEKKEYDVETIKFKWFF